MKRIRYINPSHRKRCLLTWSGLGADQCMPSYPGGEMDPVRGVIAARSRGYQSYLSVFEIYNHILSPPKNMRLMLIWSLVYGNYCQIVVFWN